VDYYLRKKLAYHPVRRAFQPVTVVVAEEGGEVTVYGVNDTPQDWAVELRSGLFTLAGTLPLDESRFVTLPANASTPLARFPRAQWEQRGLERSGAFAVLMKDGRVHAQHRLFLARFKDLAFASPQIAMAVERGQLTLVSDVFAWGVCLDVDGELPLADNCFDLLPRIAYSLPWRDELGAPRIVRLGNRDAVAPRKET
jgi:beta-mannosidase